MQFPELTQISNNLVLSIQLIGTTFLAVILGILFIALGTSFGNEHKLSILKVAFACVALGFLGIMIVPAIVHFAVHMTPVVKP